MEDLTFAELRDRGPNFLFPLSHAPLDNDSVKFHYDYQFATPSGAKAKNMIRTGSSAPVEIRVDDSNPKALVSLVNPIKAIAAAGAKGPWLVRVWFSYTISLPHLDAADSSEDDGSEG